MKLLVLLTFVCVIVASEGAAKEFEDNRPLLPCVKCTTDYSPVCAKPNMGGPPQTFPNRCQSKSANCGQREPRKQNKKAFENEFTWNLL